MPERRPPFDFKAVPTKNFMMLRIKKSFFTGVKKEEGEPDYTWYAWTFITPEGQEELAFTPEKLHQLFVSLGFRVGTEFGLKRIAVISETSDRANVSFTVRYDGQEHMAGDSNGSESLPTEDLEGLKSSAQKIPVNKQEILKQENDKGFEVWCSYHEKLYEATMNTVLDKEMDRFHRLYPKQFESPEARLKLELLLHERAATKICTLLIGFQKNGGR